MDTVAGDRRLRARGRWPGLVLAAALCLPAVAAERAATATTGATTLRARIHALAVEHGFHVKGLEKVADAPAPSAGGALASRLRVLLEDYNHVVERTADGVSRVIVIGAKTPVEQAFSLPTARRGAHHTVRATLHGAPGHRATTPLLVDTGASSVILPASLMAGLGYRAEDLVDQETQTVNGRLTGKLARLERLSVGAASADDVDVLFVPDDRLGDTGLLGMSFLGQFRVTIDDDGDRLLLTPR